VLSHYIAEPDKVKEFPGFPHLAMLVSGGHTLIVKVTSYCDMEIIGRTIDDAAGEAFDKCAKVMGMPYPGGPHINRLAADGDPLRFRFAKPRIPELDFSFSGLKTSFLYFLRDEMVNQSAFIEDNKIDLCASLQHTITEILCEKAAEAVRITGITTITLSGGVSANTYLRDYLTRLAEKKKWKVFLPPPVFTTDNAAMIGIAGYYKYLKGDFGHLNDAPDAGMRVGG
jgi:N6-L-threonylcarbamoyladenine synthase